jgi:UDP:flavonoid glycosyltransferase YjiC (YdhE family)
MVGSLLDTGARVLVNSGWNGRSETGLNLCVRPLFDPVAATVASNLVVCAGGVGACYMNMQQGVPSLVVPMQPEQATNGIHLSRAGCGRVLTTNLVFLDGLRQYERALDLGALRDAAKGMLAEQRTNTDMSRISQTLRCWDTRGRFLDCLRAMF